MRRDSTWIGAVLAICAALIVAMAAGGCGERKQAETSGTSATNEAAGQQGTQPAEGTQAPKVVQPAPPGTIRASHILLAYQGSGVETATRTKEEARKLAEEMLARVRKGESFEQLAATYSDCPSAEAGGDLGFFARGRMVRPFDEASFALKTGQVSGIVETQFGYHIIKRTQ